jgi:hypothetical protein
MAVVVDNYNDATYTLVINSNDKISGTNNNATFDINWSDFLPVEFERYKMVFTFQTTGGYYADGFYLKTYGTAPPGYTTSRTVTNAGSSTINVGISTGAVTVGMLVSCVGVLSGTTVIAYTTGASGIITLSQPTYAGIANSTVVSYYSTTDVNNVNFSAGRIAMSTGTRSYSFDTATKAPSINLGIIQRDIQTSQTKSNTLSSFYCQNPPRTINRPNQNQVTVTIYNNCVFQGGTLSNTAFTGATYSTTPTNTNLLTDSTVNGSFFSADMTPWTMLIEFIPVANSKTKKYYDV